MKVDVNELEFIRVNAPDGFYSIVAANLTAKGMPTTRFQVNNEIRNLKDEFNENIITEARKVFSLLTDGLTYQKQLA